MHPLIEFCYLKLYLYYLRCYGYILLIYFHALTTYVPILRTFIYVKSYVSRILRDFFFHARLKLKHSHRQWRIFHSKVMRALRDSVLAVLSDPSRLKIPDPPVPDLLLSNQAPTDTEFNLVKNAIQRAKEERIRLSAELILGKSSNRHDLFWETVTRHKISFVSSFIDQHHGIISPLRRVPPEILQLIFLFVVPICSDLPRSWKLTSDVPWVLGQVCRKWRSSALSYSPLWSCFPKIELRATKSRTLMQLEMVDELLNRSGVAPLNIFVNALPESYHLQTHPTLDLLTKSSERWVVAAFALSVKLTNSLETVKGHLPLLERLFIHDHIELGVHSVPFDTFRFAPRLRAVNTSAIHHLELPVDQIISCKVEFSASHFLGQVLHCPTPCPLENLTILELLDPHAVVPVTLPRLLKFSARFWSARDASVLQKFTLPVIEHIVILCCEPNVLLMNLIAMLSNCKDQESTLKHLWYRIPDPEEEGLSDLLALLPNLIELDVNLPKLNHIQNLINGYMNRNLVPLLDTCKFHVKSHQVDDKTADVLNHLAESRCELMSADPTVWGDGGSKSAFSFPDEVRPLRSLLVYSEDRNVIHSLNGLVNGYKHTPTYGALISAVAQLANAVESANRIGSKRKTLDSELDSLLNYIEAIDVQDVKDIYCSGLHLSLQLLRNWRNQSKEQYGHRAHRILERWEALFKTNWGTRKWALKGLFCLTYIGRNDPFRTSSRKMEIAYEITPPMSIVEALWPRTTLRDFA